MNQSELVPFAQSVALAILAAVSGGTGSGSGQPQAAESRPEGASAQSKSKAKKRTKAQVENSEPDVEGYVYDVNGRALTGPCTCMGCDGCI